ncbi:hypothetical protein REPUB_Repub11eG0055800 [Reevesia pubescens]
MKSQKSLSLFLVFFACLLYFSHAYRNFYVGGKDGWVLQPKEKYNDWAGRQRFQLNDTLIFKYEKGSDSVLLVHKDDYNKCNIKNPVKKMTSGNSEFQFPHSGPFFFISGKQGHCQKGQKLNTVVMAVRKGTQPPSTSPFPSPGPAHSPKHHGPVVEPPKASSPGPALAPKSPSPVAEPPKESSPSPAPFSGPTVSPTPHGPVAEPPKPSSPTPAPAPSTHHSPSHSPMAHGPIAYPPKATSPSPSFSPSSPTPASTPSHSHGPVEAPTPATTSSPPAPPQAPSVSPSVSPSPTGSQVPSGSQTGAPANENPPAPAPSKSYANATYSSMMVLAASVLLSMVFGSFVGGF